MSRDRNQAVRDIVKGASVVSIGLFVELLIAFIAQVIAARYLSVTGFGSLITGTAFLNVGAIVAGLGLGSGLTRYLPRVDEPSKRSIVEVTVGITALMSFALGVVLALHAEFIGTVVFNDPSVVTSIAIFSAAIPFAALLNVSIGGIRGQQNSRYRVYVKNILQPSLRFVLLIVAIALGLDQTGIAGAYALPYVASALIALVLLYRTLPAARGSFDRDLTIDMTRYSLPFTLSDLAGFVYRSIDVFLVLRFLGSAAVGTYGIAYAAVSFMGVFSTAFNYLASPVASELEKNDTASVVIGTFRSITRWLVIASACALIPLGVFASEFIAGIYGSEYVGGSTALVILAIGFAIKNVLSVHGPILEALGRSKELSFNSVVAAVSNVLLNVALIPSFGIVGAAVATVLAFLVRDGLAVWQVYRYLGTVPVTRESLGPALLAVPFLFLLALVADSVPISLFWLLSVTTVAALLYVSGVLVLFGLSETEVMIVRSIEEKYGLDLGPVDPIIDRLS
ncbi:hypothetical protein BRC86_11400 [Halobacteriales archaeon QS_3_64_16]|nr:MAG: hypothetical protein BRC86_11400 [Halobacteriales archaeon QS_3_64_16]